MASGMWICAFSGRAVARRCGVHGTMEILILLAAAGVAGAMNAVAGGGTILTFPALIAFGMPAIQANATSTLALLAGIAGGLYGYRGHLPAVRPWLRTFAPVSVVGGFLGAWLLTRTSEAVFERLVPFLILLATVLFLLNDGARRLAEFETTVVAGKSGMVPVALVLQFGVAVYGGYFGAGIGILMLATMGLMGLGHIHEMNAIKTVLGALINVVAASYFIWAGLVVWPQAAVMTVGAAAGYYFGSSFAQRISQRQVRNLVAITGITISILLFWREFFMH